MKAGYPFAVLDGTLIRMDRVAADRPFFSGKHRCHGMNLQVISGSAGQLLWVSGALPGSVHDMKAAWIWGIEPELAAAGSSRWPTRATRAPSTRKSRTGAGKTGIPKTSQPGPRETPRPGERANAQLKVWKILTRLRCCPWRAGHIAKAILVLQAHETKQDEKGSVSAELL